ncbi:translation elongation factor EF-1 subunit alpha [archaeon 13_1_40CM_4_53_4]|nr:MAG: translation elongation factor EF-1 subunit alpha [archaeon 13_2_20CM_2_53_6]OLC64116.1 MAG: translation elongation factor EF-1 subunit alpha [archaeon 13_1_40CM_4_53_4]OLE59002.1 MAG: translation elongation factor EF-1 subunit alpha [Crenarchaeota archaeon 13_1_20CM_2_53_14]TMI23859.1 MAG: translation elongation factor EF-1 subunit alpha [Candidatus Bathyarchaeota archaeon]
MSAKPHLNLIVMGHVDHGKSTLTGHLLFDAGYIDQKTIDAYAKESEKTGAGETFKFAWVLDTIKEERERGVTIDLSFQKFETTKNFFTIIDAPGHRDFIKNMITGASQADVAILVVSAKKGEFEVAIGPGGQAREHAYLALTLGVRQLIVAINKMDDQTVKYGEERYKEARKELEGLLKTVGYDVSKINFIPTSGWLGDNLAKSSPNTPWYKGPTILVALDQIIPPPKPLDKPLRVPIQDVYTITGVGTVPVGRVETGVLKDGDKVIFMPSGKLGEVKTIETHHVRMAKAEPGDNIGFNVRGVAKNEIGRGEVMGHTDKPPTVAKSFIGRIIVIYHPTAIAAGYTPVLHAHTATVGVTFEELIQKLDPRTGQVVEEKPSFLKVGDSAIVKMAPLRSVVLENFKEIPELGRFAIRDMGATIGVGVVQEIKEKGEIPKA